MALATYPSVSSPVKSVQRGSAAGAGTVTITAIDISKSFVNIFGTTSSGTVAATGAISAVNLAGAGSGNIAGNYKRNDATSFNANTYNTNSVVTSDGTQTINAFPMAGNVTNLSGGTNNLVAAVVQGYLSGSTSLVVSGACRWEVVEFN